MNLEKILNLSGFFRPTPNKVGFVIPVFTDGNREWVQDIFDGQTIGVLPWGGTTLSADVKCDTSSFETEPVYGFEIEPGRAVFGRREELLAILRKHVSKLANRPLVKLDALVFMEDKSELKGALEDATQLISARSQRVAERWRTNKLAELRNLGLLDTDVSPMTGEGKVLVVDDSRTVRHATTLMLRRIGMEVQTASDGDEALRLIDSSKPDVVLLDVRLPGTNGFEVCRHMRRKKQFDNVSIVFMSTLEESKVRKPMELLGELDFIHKPLQSMNLRSTLEQLLIKKAVEHR